MDVFTGFDIAGGDADVLTVFHHRLPLADIAGSQLMVNGDVLQNRERDLFALADVGRRFTLGDRLNATLSLGSIIIALRMGNYSFYKR